MKLEKYDAVIIGTGQAGPPLAAQLTHSGMSVAIIERKLFGGTCVNTGCIPTKALIASARAAHIAKRASDFGIEISGKINVDMQKVKQRKDKIAGTGHNEIPEWMQKNSNLKVYKGHAKFKDRNTIRIGKEHIAADKIFINVGARARIPDISGLDKINYMTNSDMMDVDFLPEHLVIIGGSYIGLEFGQMYRRFGSKVSVIELGDRLIQYEDEDISDSIREILESEGINLNLNAECIGVEKKKDKIAVHIDCQDGKQQVLGSHLLLAVGRVPNTHDLGLEKTGIKTDEKGYIQVDDFLQCNISNIWALGDCNGRGAFTHTSYNDYEIVAANLLENDRRKVSDRITCFALYTDPPLGRVGMTESQAKKSGLNVLVGKMPMAKIGRAREKSETAGFMKILVDADSKLIIGASILGVGGDEIIHSIIDIMYAAKPYTVIERAVHIHPTVTELIPTMLENLKPLK